MKKIGLEKPDICISVVTILPVLCPLNAQITQRFRFMVCKILKSNASNLQLFRYIMIIQYLMILNYHLPVLSAVGIIIDWIKRGIDSRLRKEQAGYRRGRGTEQVFILRNIIEQVNEWQATLHLTFVDFEKAFDSVHRWLIMKKYGIPEKFMKTFNEDFQRVCEWFQIKSGVKQGSNMSGFLFLIITDWVMRRTVGHGKNGIRWRFTSKLDDLDFAEDITTLSATKQQMQDKTRRMEEEAKRVGLKVNTAKTKRGRQERPEEQTLKSKRCFH